MSEFDDIDGGEGDIDGDAAEAGAGDQTFAAAAASSAGACLSCSNLVAGPFCAWCGQKNDDLRRSSVILARDFMGDTFGFDSRMWRTLGLMAVAPGLVPKNYAHGKRSRFTPPVRLFLVVSFLFFMTIALTKTMFVAIDVDFADEKAERPASAANAGVEFMTNKDEKCGFNANLRFFVKENDLDIDTKRLDKCLAGLGDEVRTELNDAQAQAAEAGADVGPESEAAIAAVERAFGGVSWAVANPRAFNNAFNNWLPRILFLMTPVLALLLTLFIRGRDALIFDHLVLSLYSHAAGFAIVGASLVLAQIGLPNMGLAAFAAVALYYFVALKRTYGRGWIKTFWTALVSGFFYLIILLVVMSAIVSNIIWRASA